MDEKILTVGDKMRAAMGESLTDEEIVEIWDRIITGGCLTGFGKCIGDCKTCWFSWLRSPANDGGDEK